MTNWKHDDVLQSVRDNIIGIDLLRKTQREGREFMASMNHLANAAAGDRVNRFLRTPENTARRLVELSLEITEDLLFRQFFSSIYMARNPVDPDAHIKDEKTNAIIGAVGVAELMAEIEAWLEVVPAGEAHTNRVWLENNGFNLSVLES